MRLKSDCSALLMQKIPFFICKSMFFNLKQWLLNIPFCDGSDIVTTTSHV